MKSEPHLVDALKSTERRILFFLGIAGVLITVTAILWVVLLRGGSDPGLDSGPRGRRTESVCTCPPNLFSHMREGETLPRDAFLSIDMCGMYHVLTVDFRLVDMPQGRPLYSIEAFLDGRADRDASMRFSTTFYAQVDQAPGGLIRIGDRRQEVLLDAYVLNAALVVYAGLTRGDLLCIRRHSLDAAQLP